MIQHHEGGLISTFLILLCNQNDNRESSTCAIYIPTAERPFRTDSTTVAVAAADIYQKNTSKRHTPTLQYTLCNLLVNARSTGASMYRLTDVLLDYRFTTMGFSIHRQNRTACSYEYRYISVLSTYPCIGLPTYPLWKIRRIVIDTSARLSGGGRNANEHYRTPIQHQCISVQYVFTATFDATTSSVNGDLLCERGC